MQREGAAAVRALHHTLGSKGRVQGLKCIAIQEVT